MSMEIRITCLPSTQLNITLPEKPKKLDLSDLQIAIRELGAAFSRHKQATLAKEAENTWQPSERVIIINRMPPIYINDSAETISILKEIRSSVLDVSTKLDNLYFDLLCKMTRLSDHENA